MSPNPYLLPVQNGGPPGVAGVGGVHHHQVYRHPSHHGSIYTAPHPTATSSSLSYNPPNQSIRSNHLPQHHGNMPPHHFSSQQQQQQHAHNLHQQQHHNPHRPHSPHQAHHPHQPPHHQTHSTNYGRTSPIPPPSKFIQPTTVPRRSTSPVSQLAPTSAAGGGGYPRPGSRSPPPIPGRVSPKFNSQSRGPSHGHSRAQTQL